MTHWHRFLVGVLFTTVLSVVALAPAQDVVKVSEKCGDKASAANNKDPVVRHAV